ncbi:hypothetical protein KM043_004339 [Ampulex compressa]|nr:hypothetical protein KM043_004339 [Ampulex compressa]
MLAANSSYGRRGRLIGTPTTATNTGSSGTYLARPRLPLRSYPKPKPLAGLSTYADHALARMKRLKSKKVNGVQKMDLNKKKSADYTEIAYREAVSKLKYLLAESYVPRATDRKSQGVRNIYHASNSRINESGEDTDDRSMVSDCSRAKHVIGNSQTFANSYFPSSKNIQPSKACSNLALSAADLQSVPPELTSFIERQEEYIEQLEQESQYCRDELSNLLRKVREVVAENEALHNKNKSGFLKSAIEEHKSYHEENNQTDKQSPTQTEIFATKKPKILEGPSIVFESRISELEAQLTQARLELRKTQEENQANLKKLSENSFNNGNPEIKVQLDQALRAKYEVEIKLEELQKSLSMTRDKEVEATQKAKRSMDTLQQVEFEKTQSETEVRRLKDELDRQHEKLREATQEANRRIADERQQAERRYSQQVEQLSADIATHWDAANKSQLESEKQRRELMELRRDLSQKQTFIDNLKKELQNKISSLQSELNQAITEKDAADQELLAAKLAAERSERQARQEQSRLHTEINSYKQRLERADADLVHCRRENLRLSEQIASLEKELNMNKPMRPEDTSMQTPSKVENEKELTSMIMDLETKHAATVAGLEDALNNQATLVSQLTAECQSLTQRLEANNLKHKYICSSRSK